MSKKNCWEFKDCGREPNGAKVDKHGTCPASTENNLDGVHGGINAGRACWIVAGSMCDGTIQGTFAQKYQDCKKCDFFNNVKKEEGAEWKIAMKLINKVSLNPVSQ